jgi:hypothetical protein
MSDKDDGQMTFQINMLAIIPCLNCGLTYDQHADKKCPFEASNYAEDKEFTEDMEWLKLAETPGFATKLTTLKIKLT